MKAEQYVFNLWNYWISQLSERQISTLPSIMTRGLVCSRNFAFVCVLVFRVAAYKQNGTCLFKLIFLFWRYLTRGLIWHLSHIFIRPSVFLVWLWNHARIRSWNQPVPSNKGKVSCSRKQLGPLMWLIDYCRHVCLFQSEE